MPNFNGANPGAQAGSKGTATGWAEDVE
jgi:hypothetical protein